MDSIYPQSFSSYLENNHLNVTNLTQSQFSTNYTAWLTQVFNNDAVQTWLKLQGYSYTDGQFTVSLNQNSGSLLPTISYKMGTTTVTIDQATLDVLFGSKVEIDVTTGKVTQERYYADFDAAPVVSGAVTGAATEDGPAVRLDALANATDTDTGTTLSVVDIQTTLPPGVIYDAATHTFTLDPANAAYQSLAAGEKMTVTVEYAVSDGFLKTAASVSWTVTGTNDAPVITSGVQAGTVTEDTALTATGQVTASDVDHGAVLAYSIQGNAGGAYGSLSVNETTGAWTYTLANDAHQNLAQGESHEEVFTVLVTDDQGATTTQTVTVTVQGTNDAPVVSGPVTGSATEDGAVSALNALANASDVDDNTTLSLVNVPANLPAGVSYDAATRAFTLDPTDAAYQHLAAGQTTTVTVNYGVSDGITSTPASVSWTVTGTNDLATIGGTHAGAVTEDTSGETSTGGALSVSDVDTGENVFQAVSDSALHGTYGDFTFNDATGAWTYALDHEKADSLTGGEQVSDHLVVTSKDGTATETITVSITGTNDLATIGGTHAGAVTEDTSGETSTGGTLSVSDVDTGENVFQAVSDSALHGTYGDFTFNDATGAWTYALDHEKADSLTGGEQVSDHLVVTSKDGTASQTIMVDITGTNDDAAISGKNAGAVHEDAVAPGELSTASGTLTVSDVDAGESVFQAVAAGALAKEYGTFSFDENSGAWTFTIDNAAAQSLGSGEIAHQSLAVMSKDGTATETITVDVVGKNDAPDVHVSNPVAVTEGNAGTAAVETLVIADHVTITDVDINDVRVPYVAGSLALAGTTGPVPVGGLASLFQLDATSGKVTYDKAAFDYLAQGQTVTATFGFDVKSGPDVVHQTITVTINGEDDGHPPTATNDVWVVSNGSNFTASAAWLTSNDSDIDGDPIFVTDVMVNGVSLSGTNSLGWSLTKDPAGHVTGINIKGMPSTDVSLSYTLADSSGATSSGQVTVKSVTTKGTADTVDLSSTAYNYSYIDAQNGNDTLTGGQTAPAKWVGSFGIDTFIGSGGADTMTGGAGADTFVWNNLNSSGTGAGNRDVVTDFSGSWGQADKLDLSGLNLDQSHVTWHDSGTGATIVDVVGNNSNQHFEIELRNVSSNKLSFGDFIF